MIRAKRRQQGSRLRACLVILSILIAIDVGLQTYLSLFASREFALKATSMRDGLGHHSMRVSFPENGASDFESERNDFENGNGHAGLVLTLLSGTTYEVRLNNKPTDNVAVTLQDEDDCFRYYGPSGIVFTPDNWQNGCLINVDFKHGRSCPGRILHQVYSTDIRYDGLHVRAKPFSDYFPMTRLADRRRYDSQEQTPSPYNRPETDEKDSGNGSVHLAEETSPEETAFVAVHESESSNQDDSQDVEDDDEFLKEDSGKQGGNGSSESNQLQEGSSNSNGGKKKQQKQNKKKLLQEKLQEKKRLEAIKFESIDNFEIDYDIKALVRHYNCTQTKHQNKAVKCALAERTDYTTYFYIISAPGLKFSKKAPLALIIGGVHGKEIAGFEAAGIVKTWVPKVGRFIVIDRVNRRGIEKHTRYVPNVHHKNGHHSPNINNNHDATSGGDNSHALNANGGNKTTQHDDLNRDFPDEVDVEPTSVLAKSIWTLVAKLKPKLFLDLHEGWGFYAQRKYDEPKSESHLLSNPKFSKGSSVIATSNALDMAQYMVDIVNGQIRDQRHRFDVISPPIAGGLARRMFNAFDTKAFVLETTMQNQPPEKRISQHLQMVSSLLSKIGFLAHDFHPGKVKLRKDVKKVNLASPSKSRSSNRKNTMNRDGPASQAVLPSIARTHDFGVEI